MIQMVQMIQKETRGAASQVPAGELVQVSTQHVPHGPQHQRRPGQQSAARQAEALKGAHGLKARGSNPLETKNPLEPLECGKPLGLLSVLGAIRTATQPVIRSSSFLIYSSADLHQTRSCHKSVLGCPMLMTATDITAVLF